MKRCFMIALAIALALSLSACAKQNGESGVPDDFCFSIEWGCNGDSTYDSKSGRLIKQKIATHVEDYTAAFFLSDVQKAEIFTLVKDMKPETYPDQYNPLKGASKPTRDIVFTVTYNGKTKTISCLHVSLGDTPEGAKGTKFMKVHDTIVGILTSSDAWTALPDYEFHYQ